MFVWVKHKQKNLSFIYNYVLKGDEMLCYFGNVN